MKKKIVSGLVVVVAVFISATVVAQEGGDECGLIVKYFSTQMGEFMVCSASECDHVPVVKNAKCECGDEDDQLKQSDVCSIVITPQGYVVKDVVDGGVDEMGRLTSAPLDEVSSIVEVGGRIFLMVVFEDFESGGYTSVVEYDAESHLLRELVDMIPGRVDYVGGDGTVFALAERADCPEFEGLLVYADSGWRKIEVDDEEKVVWCTSTSQAVALYDDGIHVIVLIDRGATSKPRVVRLNTFTLQIEEVCEEFNGAVPKWNHYPINW